MKGELFAAFLGVLLLPSLVFACLDSQQVSALDNISTAANVSNSSLISIFEQWCNRTDTINHSIPNVSNFTTFDYVRGVNDSLSSHINSTQNLMNSRMDALEGVVWNNVSRQKVSLEDIFDQKVKSMSSTFATKTELNNTKLEIGGWLKRTIPWWINYTPLAVGGLILSLAAVVKWQRTREMKLTALHPDIDPTAHNIEELMTESEMRGARIDLKDAKRRILESKLKPEDKIKALDTLFRSIVTKKELDMLLKRSGEK